jgi:hypothetical protein
LYYFLQDNNPVNANFIESIGGTVGFSEGFDIYIYQNLAGDSKVVFKFRDIEKEIDVVGLRKYC